MHQFETCSPTQKLHESRNSKLVQSVEVLPPYRFSNSMIQKIGFTVISPNNCRKSSYGRETDLQQRFHQLACLRGSHESRQEQPSREEKPVDTGVEALNTVGAKRIQTKWPEELDTALDIILPGKSGRFGSENRL